MKNIKSILSFLKIGAIGFGGGTALIPVIEREAIERNNIITHDEFREELVLQGITPGALPLKVACGVGVKKSSLFAVALTYAVGIVGMILAILLTALLSVASDGVLTQAMYISVGISAFIIVVVMKFVMKVPRDSRKDSFFVQGLILFVLALIFSAGSKLESFAELFVDYEVNLYIPQLSITTVLILGVNFVLFTGFKWERSITCILKYLLALAVTVVGVLAFCDQRIIDNNIVNIVLYTVIALMIASSVAIDIINAKKHKSSSKSKVSVKVPLIAIGILILPCAVLMTICAALGVTDIGAFFSMTGNSMLSVVTTFGGGTAYISVAEGVFVGGGLVSNDLFWSQIVPISNALPGPLLVKMLASVWYYMAFSAGAGVGISVLFAVYGGVLGITVTTSVYLLIYILFQYVKGISLFDRLKISILPMIAGLLVPTMLSILINMTDISVGAGMPAYGGILLAVGLIGLSAFVARIKMPEPLAIITLGGMSFGIINLVTCLI